MKLRDGASSERKRKRESEREKKKKRKKMRRKKKNNNKKKRKKKKEEENIRGFLGFSFFSSLSPVSCKPVSFSTAKVIISSATLQSS